MDGAVPPFGSLLKQHRAAAGLTQEELAELAGLSSRAISDLERGLKRQPHTYTVRQLIGALQLEQDDAARFQRSARHPHLSPSEHQEAGAPVRPAPALPVQATPFIGRKREIEEVCAILRSPRVSLLTLTGTGGVGKTRLGLRVAEEMQPDFPDGIVFVSLASLTDPGLVTSTIAAALALTEMSGETILERLIEHLREKRMLLLLDNFEHLAVAAVVLSQLLAACLRLVMVVTSRAVLHLAAEHEYPVAALPVPTPLHLPEVDALARYDAIQLFLKRAAAVKPNFQLTSSNAWAVAEICRKLEGIPLAIELAAARIRILPPVALLRRLDRRLEVLTGGARDLPRRQQTMQDALAWSYDLLSDSEQALFRRLAVFPGGAAIEAVEATYSRPSSLGMDILDGLTSLVDKSLLLVQEGEVEAGYPQPRFVMLDTIREFGLDRLRAAAEEDAARRAHAGWCLSLADAAEPQLRGREQRAWLTRLDREHPNLLAALRWAEESGEVALGLRLATALWRYWSTRGHYSEARRRLEALLSLDARAGYRAPTVLRTAALNQLARFADRQGDLELTMELSRESLTLARAAGDKPGIAAALSTVAGVLKQQGNYREATVTLEECLALRRELGDKARIASTLNNLGGAARWQRQTDRAGTLFKEALELYTQLGDTAAIAHMMYRLGEVALDRCDLTAACGMYKESLILRKDLEDKEGIGFVLNGMALVAHAEGAYEQAVELSEQSIAIFRELGAKRQISCMLDTLARIVLDAGDTDRAAEAYRESLALAVEAGAKELVPYGLEGLGHIATKRGDATSGARLYGGGSALRDSLNTPPAGHEQEAYERALGEMRLALGEDAFTAAWEAGRAWPIEESTAFALGSVRPWRR